MSPDTDVPAAQEREQLASDALTPGLSLVGIGASAGGLEAITELLANVTDANGMTFLVVQHLDPDHASLLTELLGKKTALPVVEVQENQLIEPNHVYVIPPNNSMTVSDGHLRLKPRESSQGLPMPVDDLFCSLAENLGGSAIGVCLSGSGSDGARGVEAIKGGGGITFAQDDASAKFTSMPQAAVGTGCVDFVLSPKEIAARLMRINQHPMMPRPSTRLKGDPPAAEEANLEAVFRILDDACKHDFSRYKRGTLTRRLTRRIALSNLNSLEEYIRLLKSNPHEVQALYQDLLIRVTSFFRDPEAFEGLFEKVFPTLEQRLTTGGAIRIWVPGCSTGEEVYSIAISLTEYLEERSVSTRIQIFGTDVSDSALATARAGIYLENIANEVSAARLERFFTRSNGKHQVVKSLRNLCIFAMHNVTCDPPFSQLDLISCRNVLIYFNPVLQRRVISLFHYALKPGGCLTLGPSESIGAATDMFSQSHDNKYNIFTKKSVPLRSHLAYLSGSKSPASVQPSAPQVDAAGQQGKQARTVDRIAMARFVPAGVLCDDELNILEFRGDTGPYLLQPSGPPSTSLRQLARLGLFVDINSMIDMARTELQPVRRTAHRVQLRDGTGEVDLEVIPIAPENTEEPLFLVFFDSSHVGGLPPIKRFSKLWARLRSACLGKGEASGDAALVQRLQYELDATRQYIKTMTSEHCTAQEEIKASQEELLSSNEEFQSTNEELETAKEELQSSNEELISTNDELMCRNQELHDLNSELKRARDYAQAIVETVRKPLVVLDAQFRIVRTNAAFQNAFHLAPSQTAGCLLYELDNRQWDIPSLRQLLGEVLPKEQAFENCEITGEFSNIGRRTMVLNGKHLVWDKEALILLAIEDVTESKLAQEERADAAKRKDEFLAMLAHELRNPLAPIRNALEILRRGDAGDKAEQQAMLVMDRQLRKEARLIDDLLDIARITQGSIVLKNELVDLRQILNQAVESTQHQYTGRDHLLQILVPETEITVKGDTVRLEQIFSNLLSNSAKYTEPGGRILLKLEVVDEVAIIRVIDNGIGISAEMLPRIFDLFVQAEVSLDRSQGGLGIGLALVRRLLELQGGAIHAESKGPNQGSEFIVRLPIAHGAATAQEPAAADSPANAPQPGPVASRRILIVDDNMDSANTCAMLLQLEGHDVQTVYDGPAALELVGQFRPEVVLMDIGLPGMDGYQVMRSLRKMPDLEGVLLVAVSGYAPVPDQERTVSQAFDHYLMKPVELEQLRSLIAGLDGR